MLLNLLLLGLAVTPFILAPGSSDIAREPKMAWALVFALSIGLVSLFNGLKPFKNKWALCLIGFCLISFYLSPKPELKLFGIESGRFWSWEPMYQGLVFLLFTVSIASLKITHRSFDWIINTMVWCGFLMGAFTIMQFLHLDQFFEHRYGTYGHMAGTLGNPTLVGPFLCINIPLCLIKKRRVFAITMIIAVIVTRSDVALLGLLACGYFYFILKNKKRFIMGVICGLLIVIGTGVAYFSSPSFRGMCPDNERFMVWGNSLTDLTQPVMQNSKKMYATTGIGQGSFKYLYHAKHDVGKPESFIYAHNDYVQVAYELGVVGLILFLGTIWFSVSGGFGDPTRRVLLSSLAGVLVCAAGIFVLQIGTHIFYVLTIIGLLHNDYLSQGGDYAG